MYPINLDELLKNASRVGISGHIRPDGDCVGSCIGLMQFISIYYPKTDCRLYLDPIPDIFQFLEGTDRIVHDAGEDVSFDVFFALDCSEPERLGDHAVYLKKAEKTVCIDHHITSQPFTDLAYVDPQASSASELVCRLIGTDRITEPMAEALYMGIVHDTGVFQYSCTSSETMAIAGKLMDKGIPFSRIVNETFYEKTYLQNQILGRALLESILLCSGKVVFSALRRSDLEFFGVTPKDLDGIVAQLRSIKGVETAIFLYETAPREWKVSLRSSNYIDVAQIASFFGGGGHVRAAGCSMQGSVHDVINNLTKHIEEQELHV